MNKIESLSQNWGKLNNNQKRTIKIGVTLLVAGVAAGLLAAFVPQGTWQTMGNTLGQHVWTPVKGFAADHALILKWVGGVSGGILGLSIIAYAGSKHIKKCQKEELSKLQETKRDTENGTSPETEEERILREMARGTGKWTKPVETEAEAILREMARGTLVITEEERLHRRDKSFSETTSETTNDNSINSRIMIEDDEAF